MSVPEGKVKVMMTWRDMECSGIIVRGEYVIYAEINSASNFAFSRLLDESFKKSLAVRI